MTPVLGRGDGSEAVIETPASGPPLTRRQLDVLQLLAEGFTAGQIAGLLGCAPSTVTTHIYHCHLRLNVSTTVGAVVVAIRQGWIE